MITVEDVRSRRDEARRAWRQFTTTKPATNEHWQADLNRLTTQMFVWNRVLRECQRGVSPIIAVLGR